MNDLIHAKLKEIVQLQNIMNKEDLNYKSKCGKTYKFGKFSLSIFVLRDIHEGYLSLENAKLKKSNFDIELKKQQKHLKKYFVNNLGLLLRAREEVLQLATKPDYFQ